MTAQPTLPDVPANDIIEHLNELLARVLAENRELMRLLRHRERQIELLAGTRTAPCAKGER